MAKEKKELKPLKKANLGLSAFKAKNKLNDGIKDKELEWIKLGSAFHKATGLPGFPKGFVSIIRGHSNTGKSTAMALAAVTCQREGILPVIIDTENSWSWDRAKLMGMEFEEIADPETGEIVNYDGFFLYVNNYHLMMNYGRNAIKNVTQASIEDVAEFCEDMISQQAGGELDYELCFIFDSVGTLNGRKSIESKNNNNMWNAGSYNSAFKSLLGYQIPGSRKENMKYTNTFIAVQKIWLQPNAVGQPTVKHSGGEFWWYNPRIIVHIGGANSNSLKAHTATSNGQSYIIGTECKISVVKHQLTYDGTPLSDKKIVSTPHGFIMPEDINEYKKEHRDYIMDKLKAGSDSIIEYETKGEIVEDDDVSGFSGD